MRRVLFVTIALCLVASTAMAHDTMGRFGLGFTTTQAPIGGRYWATDKVGVDAGFGVQTRSDSDFTDFYLSVGVPIRVMDTRDRAYFNVRPNFQYWNVDQSYTMMAFGAELEFEVFVTDDFSVRAAHGFSFMTTDPEGDADSTTDYGTSGMNWTSAGFYFYFP